MLNGRYAVFIVAMSISMLPALSEAEDVSPRPSLPEVSILTAPMAQAPMPHLHERENPAASVKTIPSTPKQGNKKSAKYPAVSTSAPSAARGSDYQRDNNDQKFTPGMVMEPPVTVLPETPTPVHLSSSDLNRFTCQDGDIKEALADDEKGIAIKVTGKDAFLKFKVGKRTDGKLNYSTTPSPVYIVCGGATYSMIAFPSRIPARTISLSPGTENRIKENQALYAGLPFEKRVMRAIKDVYTDNIPDSYKVSHFNKIDLSWKGLIVALRREVDVEGEGIRVKEYHVALKEGQKEPFKLSEKLFLRKEFALNPVAVSIDKHIVRPGETSRLFVVEQRPDKPLGVTGFQLPTVESPEMAPQPATQAKASQAVMPSIGSKGAPRNTVNSPAVAGGLH